MDLWRLANDLLDAHLGHKIIKEKKDQSSLRKVTGKKKIRWGELKLISICSHGQSLFFFGFADHSNCVYVPCWESGRDSSATKGCYSGFIRDNAQKRSYCNPEDQTKGFLYVNCV